MGRFGTYRLLLVIGLVSTVLVASAILPRLPVSRTPSVPALNLKCPPHCSHTDLLANINGWDFGDPDGTNNQLQKYINETFTMTLIWTDISTIYVHEFAIYPPGTTPSQVGPTSTLAITRSAIVSSTNTPVNITFSFGAKGLLHHAIYEYYCDFHPLTMHGQILVTIPGDVNGDFKVNITDFFLFVPQLGSVHANWDRFYGPRSDINRDLQVNIADFFILAKNLGASAP